MSHRDDTLRPTALLAFLVLASACGQDDPEPLVLRDYSARSAAAACAMLWDCCDADARMRFFGSTTPAPSTEEECVARLDISLAPSFAMIEAGVERGAIVYDGALAARCLEQFERTTCEAFSESLAPGATGLTECAEVFRGLVEAGGECETSLECESRFCDTIGEGPATCRGIAGEGEPCSDAICGQGFYCDVTASPAVCTASREIGAACTSPLQCSTLACEGGVCARRAPLCVPD